MPFASQHYPFENAESFQEQHFPADFIAEGLDQTRGWFYTLTVLGNKLFGKSPFQNVIVNGMILAEDGKKMSKRLKNYPEPTNVVDAYGADALRVYLISSPAVRAETLSFKESGVREVVTKVLLPLWNSYRYFADQAAMHRKLKGKLFVFDESLALRPVEERNVMDRWILANTQTLLESIKQDMEAYKLYTVLPRLRQLIEHLTNWYIHCNRKRLKGTASLGEDDTFAAVNTLFQVLFTLVRALAPFMPFLTEHIYQLLRPHLPASLVSSFADTRSVHFLPFPEADPRLLDADVERRVAAMQRVVDLARAARDRTGVGLKTPLPELVVVADETQLENVSPLVGYIKEELNVREVRLSADEDRFNVRLRPVPDWQRLGKKYRKAAQGLKTALPKLSNADFRRFLAEGSMEVNGLLLETADLSVVRDVVVSDTSKRGIANEVNGDALATYEPGFDGEFVVLLDTTSSEGQVREGLAREVIKQMNRLKKNAGVNPTDEVRMLLTVLEDPEGVDLPDVVATHREMIEAALRGPLELASSFSVMDAEKVLLEEIHDLHGLAFALKLLKV
jgi:isoleucyl-tRNA synthetase